MAGLSVCWSECAGAEGFRSYSEMCCAAVAHMGTLLSFPHSLLSLSLISFFFLTKLQRRSVPGVSDRSLCFFFSPPLFI